LEHAKLRTDYLKYARWNLRCHIELVQERSTKAHLPAHGVLIDEG